MNVNTCLGAHHPSSTLHWYHYLATPHSCKAKLQATKDYEGHGCQRLPCPTGPAVSEESCESASTQRQERGSGSIGGGPSLVHQPESTTAPGGAGRACTVPCVMVMLEVVVGPVVGFLVVVGVGVGLSVPVPHVLLGAHLVVVLWLLGLGHQGELLGLLLLLHWWRLLLLL